MAEFKTIKIEAFRTPSGRPTCAVDVPAGKVCRFLGTRRFGLVDFCMLGAQVDLDRGLEGEGYTIPHDECEVWKDE